MINKVILLGNLGRDPEMKYSTSGFPIANLSLATNEKFQNKDGDKEVRTEWHRVIAFGRLAEICGEYLSKGREVYVEGKIQTREWEDKEGIKRYTTEIVAQNIQMIGSPNNSYNNDRQNNNDHQAGRGEYQESNNYRPNQRQVRDNYGNTENDREPTNRNYNNNNMRSNNHDSWPPR